MQNTVGKLLEKNVAIKLSCELEEKGLLTLMLSRYRCGKDTQANAAVLGSDAYDGFERGEETLVAALDLKDAYDRVTYKILMTTLINMKVNPDLIIRIGDTRGSYSRLLDFGCQRDHLRYPLMSYSGHPLQSTGGSWETMDLRG